MSLLTNECSICFENFKNSKGIFTTSCGHIFHQSCMEQWRINETSCPECRVENPSYHKIFLSFEDRQRENSENIQDLKLMLQSIIEKNQQLNDQKQEVEFEFLELQELFTVIEHENKNLEERINQINDQKVEVEFEFLDLQEQFTVIEDENNNLQKRINEMNDQKQELEFELLELQEQFTVIENEKNNLQERINQMIDVEKIQELKVLLQSSDEKNQQLNDQKQEVEFEFLELQKQFTFIEDENKNLKERINQMNDAEENFLNLQAQYTEKAEHIKNLEKRINELQLLNTHIQESRERIRELKYKLTSVIDFGISFLTDFLCSKLSYILGL